jgi:HAE1 family hydrophobic/amphiphilic exporter-1
MLSELCVRRPVFATMLVMSLVVLGVFSFRDLGVDLFPKADPAQVNVSLRLPGASPDEMTSAVIMPMENALSGIAGIDQMQANVNTGGNARRSPAPCGTCRPRRCLRSFKSRIPTPIRS